MLSLFFVPFIFILINPFPYWWFSILMWSLMGLGMAGIGLSVMHDANHGAYSKNPKINKALGYCLNLIGGYDLNWRIQHNVLHHTYTNIIGMDEDVDAGIVLRFSDSQPRKWHHGYQHLYAWFLYGLMTISWILTKDFMPDKPHQSLCGKCDICIEHCPTKAIVEPFVIQSDLCIAYHTIENRDKTIPKKIEKNLGGWVAGCDICQDVCPWNKSVPYNNNHETTPKEWIKNLNIESLNWDDKTWQENLKGTTLKRIKPWMWKRNIQANIKNKKIKI